MDPRHPRVVLAENDQVVGTHRGHQRFEVYDD
jgi:hypothetical protein